jgi:hypothetical protein
MNQELVVIKLGATIMILVFLTERQYGIGSITGFLNDLRALKSLKESFVRIKIYIDFWCE